MTASENADYRRNQILAALPGADLRDLLADATPVVWEAEHTILSPGEPYSTVFFPTCGVVSGVHTLPGGQQVEIAAVGVEGLVGVGPVLSQGRAPFWFVVQIPASGYQVPLEVFVRLFDESQTLRRLTLEHTGRLLAEVARAASCNRFHTLRERLARWLLVTSHKARTSTLPFTHDLIARAVGGPRHAITDALATLRTSGAIAYQRGLIEILDEAKLVEAACECVSSARFAGPESPYSTVPTRTRRGEIFSAPISP